MKTHFIFPRFFTVGIVILWTVASGVPTLLAQSGDSRPIRGEEELPMRPETPPEMEGEVQTMTIDAQWAEQNGVPVDIPFQFNVPEAKELEVSFLTHDPANDVQELIRVTYTTEKGQLSEKVSFAPVRVQEGTLEQKLRNLSDTILSQVVPVATKDWENSEAKAVQRTKIGTEEYDAITVIGIMVDKEKELPIFCFASPAYFHLIQPAGSSPSV